MNLNARLTKIEKAIKKAIKKDVAPNAEAMQRALEEAPTDELEATIAYIEAVEQAVAEGKDRVSLPIPRLVRMMDSMIPGEFAKMGSDEVCVI